MRSPVDRESLVVGMTLVPALVSRNRSFALFQDPEVRLARVRSGELRGIVRQLTGAQGEVVSVHVKAAGGVREMSYRMPSLRLERRALLSDVEFACVAYLAGRAGVTGLSATDEDRMRIDSALRRLAAGLRLAESDTRRFPEM